jgi:hypothetical protein
MYNPYITTNYSSGEIRNEIKKRIDGAKYYTVDNSSSNFAASSNWYLATSATDKYGNDYRFRSTEAIGDAAQWNFNVPTSGSWRIEAWWSQGGNRSATAPYLAPSGTVVYVNQQANGGKWNTLRTESVSSGARNVRLSCWTTTGFVVIADAVRIYGPM